MRLAMDHKYLQGIFGLIGVVLSFLRSSLKSALLCWRELPTKPIRFVLAPEFTRQDQQCHIVYLLLVSGIELGR